MVGLWGWGQVYAAPGDAEGTEFRPASPAAIARLQEHSPSVDLSAPGTRVFEMIPSGDPSNPHGFAVTQGTGGDRVIVDTIAVGMGRAEFQSALIPVVADLFPEARFRVDSLRKADILEWKARGYEEVPGGNPGLTELHKPEPPAFEGVIRTIRPDQFESLEANETLAKKENALSASKIRALWEKGQVSVLSYSKNGEPIGHLIYRRTKKGNRILSLATNARTALAEKEIAKALIDKLPPTFGEAEGTIIEPHATSDRLREGLRGEGRFQASGSKGRLVFSPLNLNGTRLSREDFFTRLGVTTADSPRAIEQAYQRLRSSQRGNKVRQLLLEARDTLLSPQRRQQYLQKHGDTLLKNRPQLFPKQTFGPESVNLYERLGVSPNTQMPQILRAAENYAAQHGSHPGIDTAIQVLTDPVLREAYDTILLSTEGNDRDRALQRFLGQLEGKTKGPKGKSQKTVSEPATTSRRLRVTTSKPKAPNLYQRLGVAENASHQQIVDAFITTRLASTNGTTTKRLNEAFRVLGRPHLRARYDAIQVEAPSNGDALTRALIQESPQVGERERLPAMPNNRLKVTTVSPGKDNLYQRLGVPENVSPARLRNRALSLLQDPSVKGERRESIEEAFRILKEPLRREAYDQLYHHYHHESETVREGIELLGFHDLEQVRGLVSEWIPEGDEKYDLEDRLEEAIKQENKEYSERQPRLVTDLYKEAGVSPNASSETIEEAFQTATRGNSSKEQLEALKVLRVKSLRERYDTLATQKFYPSDWRQTIADLKARGERTYRFDQLEQLAKSRAPLASRSQETIRLLEDFPNHQTSQEARLIEGLVGEYAKGEAGWSEMLEFSRWLEGRHSKYSTKTDEHGESYRKTVGEARARLAFRLIDGASEASELTSLIRLFGRVGEADPIRQKLKQRATALSDKILMDRALLTDLNVISDKLRRSLSSYDLTASELVPRLTLALDLGISGELTVKDFEKIVQFMEFVTRDIKGKVHPNFEEIRNALLEAREKLAKSLVQQFGHTRGEIRKIRRLYGDLAPRDSLAKFFDAETATRPNLVQTALQAFVNACKRRHQN